jgi:hypothetical protein
MTGRRPKVIWRLVPEDQFPLQGLLQLLFEPDPERDEVEEGGDRGAA